jgi:PAS domain S-box-containing protein
MLAGLIFTIAGLLISVVQVMHWAHPAFLSAQVFDLAVDVLVVLIGGLVMWLVRSGRIRPATWFVLASLLVLAVAQLYVEGRPSTDVAGGLGLLLVVALAFVLLDRRSAWLVCAVSALSFVAIHLLWLDGHLPQPFRRDPSSNVAFSIVTWLAIVGIIAAVISSTMESLRKHREQLEGMVEERTRELREAQRRIADVLELNQSIITASSLGISAYGASGDCVLANESAAKIVGATREQVLEQNFYHIGSWKESQLLEAAEEALANGSETRRKVHVISTFGKDIWIDCRFVPFSSSGEPHLLLLADDVTEQRELQERLVRSERLAALGQLAGGVAHELRNPMAVIKNAAYFLNMLVCEGSLTEAPEPEVRESLQILAKEVEVAEDIIGSLLDCVRAKPPNRCEVDVNRLVQDLLSRPPVPEGVELVRQLDDRIPNIQADPVQLGQVFGNLIGNATQAMPDGGQLSVISERNSDELLITVKDTGVGIPEENKDKLFEPLFTTKTTGIGLGLALAKTLVQGHGGSIQVKSELGKGSTFTVRLPVDSSQ